MLLSIPSENTVMAQLPLMMFIIASGYFIFPIKGGQEMASSLGLCVLFAAVWDQIDYQLFERTTG